MADATDQSKLHEALTLRVRRTGDRFWNTNGAPTEPPLPIYLAAAETKAMELQDLLLPPFQELQAARARSIKSQHRVHQTSLEEPEAPNISVVGVIIIIAAMVAAPSFLNDPTPPFKRFLVPLRDFLLPNKHILFPGIGILLAAKVISFAVAVVLHVRRHRSWRQRYAAERAQETRLANRVSLANNRFTRLLEESVLRPALHEGLPVRWDLDHQEVAFRDGQAITSKIDPMNVIPTPVVSRLALALARREGAAIGLAGPRGGGKSELIRYITKPTADVVSIRLWAPSQVDHTAFLLQLLKQICVQVLGQRDEERNTSERLETSSTDAADDDSGEAKALALSVGILLALCGLALILGDLFNYDLRRDKMGLGIVLVVLAMLIAGFGTRIASEWLPYPDDLEPAEARLLSLAKLMLRRAEFTETYSMNAELATRLAPINAKLGLSRSQQSRPLSDVETVYKIQTLVHAIREQGQEVLVGIDELDKIGTDEEAMAFLNSIKILFPIEGCSFIVSVSENAWVRFAQRGLPFRDVFDSSFDDIFYVGRLDIKSSRDLLRARDKRITDLQCLFCHVMSGGLPRDLLRVARRIGQAAVEVSDNDFFSVTRIIFTDDVTDKARAALNRIAQVTPASHRATYTAQLFASQDAWKNHDTDTLLSTYSRPSAVPYTEWQGLAHLITTEFQVYLQYLLTVAETFRRDGPIRFLEGQPNSGPDIRLACDALAEAATLIGLDVNHARRAVVAARKYLNLSFLGLAASLDLVTQEETTQIPSPTTTEDSSPVP
jgi:hypothetical protein